MNLNTYNLPDSYRTYMAARDPAVDAYYTFRERKRPLKDTKTYCLWSQRTLEEKQPVIRTPYYQDYWAQKLMARRRETREAFAFGHAADGDGVLFFHPEDHGMGNRAERQRPPARRHFCRFPRTRHLRPRRRSAQLLLKPPAPTAKMPRLPGTGRL